MKNSNQDNTPDGCKEIEKEDGGAHCICERVTPFMSNRLSRGSAPTASIWHGYANINKLEDQWIQRELAYIISTDKSSFSRG